MQDQLLTCTNCGNPFVYSVYEQLRDNKKISVLSSQFSGKSQSSTIDNPQSTQPPHCPICTSIKASEKKHPPKPASQQTCPSGRRG